MAVIRIPASRIIVVNPSTRSVKGRRADVEAKATKPTEPKPDTGTSDKPSHANGIVVLLAFLVVALGWWLGYILFNKTPVDNGGVKFDPVDGIGLFALFFILAQALERLMEPIAELSIPNFGSSKEKPRTNVARRVKAAIAETDPAKAQEELDNGAAEQADENRIEGNTKVVIWAIATFVAMLISGSTHLFFLDAVGASGVNPSLNILLTGLVIGGGTKPLHELIKKLEKPSESSDEGGEDDGGSGNS